MVRFKQEDLARVLKYTKLLRKRDSVFLGANKSILRVAAKGDYSATALFTDIPATVDEEFGFVYLPPEKLEQLVSTFSKGDEIVIDKDKENIFVRWEKGRVKGYMKFQDSPDSVAAIPSQDIEEIMVFTINTGVLSEMLRKALPFISRETTVAYDSILGIQLMNKEDRFRVTGTDGHRLAMIEQEISIGMEVGEWEQIVITPEFAKLIRTVGDKEGKTKITVGSYKQEGSGQILKAEIGNTIFIDRGFAGQYPDCDAVFPEGKKWCVKVHKKEFKRAIRGLKNVSDPMTRLLQLCFDYEKLQLRVTSEIGNATEDIDCDWVDKGEEKPPTIGVNCFYLEDVLKTINEEDIVIWINGPQQALMFYPVENLEERYLLMPVLV